MVTRRRIVRRITAPVVALVALATTLIVVSQTAQAGGAICGSPPCAIELSYDGPRFADPSTTDHSLCDQAQLPAHCFINLRAWLYLPGGRSIADSKPNLPLMIYVHGSTAPGRVPMARDMAFFFASHGFAFLVIQRRGHGDSTGRNIDAPVCNGCTQTQYDLAQLDNLDRQAYEVKRAISSMLKRRTGGMPLIAPGKVAVMGHSLGGIIALYANTQQLGQRTVIDVAGASKSWDTYDAEDNVIDGHGPSIEALKQVVALHQTPPMFMEPTNDCSTVPTGAFSEVVADQNEVYDATLFPDVPGTGGDCDIAHVNFILTPGEVGQWGPAVKVWTDRMFGG